jgi:UDP-N-acetyl-2-amino-2-deoxyglucuronate dehydrogenase
MTNNFALVGAAGYIAPRHMKAIRNTGNKLVAVMDPHDSVGIIDFYFPRAKFFTEIERFDRHLEKLRRKDDLDQVQYMSICSPNYLHDAHVRLALRVGATAICEKPLVINPWNLDAIQEIEEEYSGRVYTIMQLRLHPDVVALKERIASNPPDEKVDILLTYITRRGQWYHISWKGSEAKSGGLAMNIGIHFFDLLAWIFGPVEDSVVHLRQDDRMSGVLELEKARVRWFLSVNGDDLPIETVEEGGYAYRNLTMDGEVIDLSSGFEDLHTRVYEETLAGNGFGIEDARPAIDLVYDVRTSEVTRPGHHAHPKLDR